MSLIFNADFSRGQTIDQVSKTIPTNNGVVFKRTEKGRAGYFDGTAELNFGTILNEVSNGKQLSISIPFKLGKDDITQVLISKHKPLSVIPFTVQVFSEYIVVFAGDSGDTDRQVIGFSTMGMYDLKQWVLLQLTINGTTSKLYINNTLVQTDTTRLDENIINSDAPLKIGAQSHLAGYERYLEGTTAGCEIYNHILTTQERETLYQEFLNAQTIHKPVVTNRDTTVGNFDGVSYVDCGNDASVNFGTGDFSLFGRFKSSNASGQFLIGKGISSSTENGYGVFLNTGVLSLFIGQNNTRNISSTTALTYNDNKWHDFVATYNRAGNAFLYVDGNLTPVVTFDISSYTGTTNVINALRLGTYGNPIVNIFKGNLSDVGVANRILSQAEIQNFSRGITPSNIVSNWELNERGGTTAFDSVGSNNGTWTNAKNQYTNSRLNTILNIDNTNWNADGVTQSNFVGDFKIASGTFRVKEDTTGKYIDCVTNGTLKYQGLDLSEFVGNGYIERIDGDLSSDAGGTVDNATNVSFASNEISIAMTAGQVLRNVTIKRSS